MRLNKDTVGFLENPTAYLRNKKITKADKDTIRELRELFFIVDYQDQERDILRRGREKFISFLEGRKFKFNYLNFILTTSCNFNCPYCMRKKLAYSQSQFIDWPTAKEAVDFIIKRRESNKLSIDFDGGETLLNYPLIKKIVKYCNSHKGIRFDYTLLTNGFLITEEILKFLKENDFLVQISVDGFQHNTTRKDIKNKPTFDSILNTIKQIKKYKIRLRDIATTLTEDTWEGINIRFLKLVKKLRVKLAVSPDVFSFLPFDYKKLLNKMKRLIKYSIKNKIDITGVWKTDYGCNRFNNKKLIIYPRCRGLGWDGLSIHPDGYISNCSYDYHYRFKDFHSLLSHLYTKEFYQKLQGRLPGNIEYCRNCDIEGICSFCSMVLENQLVSYKQRELKEWCRFIKDITYFCIQNLY